MGKGDQYRPYSTTREEQNLRDRYARGKMTFDQFERAYRELMEQGKIKRNGRTIKENANSRRKRNVKKR